MGVNVDDDGYLRFSIDIQEEESRHNVWDEHNEPDNTVQRRLDDQRINDINRAMQIAADLGIIEYNRDEWYTDVEFSNGGEHHIGEIQITDPSIYMKSDTLSSVGHPESGIDLGAIPDREDGFGTTSRMDNLHADVEHHKSLYGGMDKSMEYRGMSREPKYNRGSGRGRLR